MVATAIHKADRRYAEDIILIGFMVISYIENNLSKPIIQHKNNQHTLYRRYLGAYPVLCGAWFNLPIAY